VLLTSVKSLIKLAPDLGNFLTAVIYDRNFFAAGRPKDFRRRNRRKQNFEIREIFPTGNGSWVKFETSAGNGKTHRPGNEERIVTGK
jgi:hypothetical protein